MGPSLAFHIVFASLGIGLPVLFLIVEGIWLETRNPIYLTLARRWAKAFAILFAVGAVASGQIRVANGAVVSDLWRTWLAPFPLVIGLLALSTCAYLAAVYLILETTGELQEDFRLRALGAGFVFIVLAALALLLARSGAPQIRRGLTSQAEIIAVPLAVGLALLSGWAVVQRRFRLARGAAAAEVALAGRMGAVPVSPTWCRRTSPIGMHRPHLP